MHNLEKELESIRKEFSEYKFETKEYEEALESEIAEKDEKINIISSENADLRFEVSALKGRLKQNEQEISRLLTELEIKAKSLLQYTLHKRQLEEVNDHWEKSARVLEFSRQTLEEKLNEAEENVILFKEELEEVTQQKEQELQRLKDSYNELRQELLLARKQGKKMNKKFVIQSEADIRIQSPCSMSRNSSRKASLETQDSASYIKIYANFAKSLNLTPFIELSTSSITIKNPKSRERLFEFSKVWGPNSTFIEISSEFQSAFKAVCEGKNCCFLAYGPCKSGKTSTIAELFNFSMNFFKQVLDENSAIEVSILEVYNEQTNNLISNSIVQDKKTIILCKNNWTEDMKKLVILTMNTRNKHMETFGSLVITLKFLLFNSVIQFVDLPSSEKNKSLPFTDLSLKESLSANRALSSLQLVLSSLANIQKHIPFRNSLLTKTIQQSISSNSTVHLILQCNGETEKLSETISTLSIVSRILPCSKLIGKSIRSLEVERTFKLLDNERREKQKLLILLEKLEKDIEIYKAASKGLKDNCENIERPLSSDKKVGNIVRLPPKGRLRKSSQSSVLSIRTVASPTNKPSRIPGPKIKSS